MAGRMNNEPAGPIEQPKLGPIGERLEKLGLVRDWDFALHLPYRYEDHTKVTPLSALPMGQAVLVEGEVIESHSFRTARGEQFLATLRDESGGMLKLRYIHYYPSVSSQLARGKFVRAYGEPRPAYGGGLEIIHPRIMTGRNALTELSDKLTPVYPAGEGIQQNWLRKRIDRALLDLVLDDPLPEEVRTRLGLPEFKPALLSIHHPDADASQASLDAHATPGWRRLIFDELLAQQVALLKVRSNRSGHEAASLKGDGSHTGKFLRGLPFALTRAQARVYKEITDDLERTSPMNRLVQGDVGSGKTVVAALAALTAIESGRQAALMAPTEILAEQHYKKLRTWLEPLGIPVHWLASSTPAAEKRRVIEELAGGEPSLTVGTHALIQDQVKFASLGLAIVDEQHRFGVAQRLGLRRNAGGELWPHLLMLSATPIPRTLAMSYLADLDVSVIDELPPGRTPVVTKLVRMSRRDDVAHLVTAAVEKGRQAYWVCPLIEESEKVDLRPAVTSYEYLKNACPGITVELIHGALPSAEKDDIMERFARGEIAVLVSTTVIEVGVDVPNATLMVIEQAEHFGLAQLHQLRGRVGRGTGRSACVLLFDEPLSENGRERLKAIRETNDGFEIARRDLELRGPGEFLGERQSGMPMLRFADLERDEPLLREAQAFARKWLETSPDEAAAFSERWFKPENDFLAA